MSGTLALGSSGILSSFIDSFGEEDTKLPFFFVGHGSPMNGIEANDFSY